ncbi:hypothetical protein KQH40_00760 [bacterium]|nr:hypothetical protein [bacterium]
MSRIQFRMKDDLARSLGQVVSPAGIYSVGVIALVGMIAVRYGIDLSIEAFEREHITTQLASAAAYGVVERDSAAQLAFDLAAFIAFERPEELTKTDALIWLTAIFKVYFDIRYSGGTLENINPLDVRGWARVLLDSEMIGLANLSDTRTIRNGEGQTEPWTIAMVALHKMAAGSKPDVYPDDLIPILSLGPGVVEAESGTDASTENGSTHTLEAYAALSQSLADEEAFL